MFREWKLGINHQNLVLVNSTQKRRGVTQTRALYGLRTSGASWRQMLSDTLTSTKFGYRQSHGDLDVYMKRRSKPNGGDYYEMVLVFVDDILCLSHKPQEFMDRFGTVYDLRRSTAEPAIYLGANIEKHQLPNGSTCWAMSSATYVKNALVNIRELLREEGKELRTTKRRGQTPLPTNYKPELDQSQELSSTFISRYLQLIGILRWAVELGRIDIAVETAIMSQYSASPREGHIEAVYHIFAYLAVHPYGKIVFDPTSPILDEECFQHDVDWKPFYGDVQEEEPNDMPIPLGLPVNKKKKTTKLLINVLSLHPTWVVDLDAALLRGRPGCCQSGRRLCF
jgi:hypothetical protein